MRFVKRALAIIITAFVIINLTACGQSPTAVSERFLTAVKEGDIDTIEDLYVDSEFKILNLVNYPDSEKKASEKEEFSRNNAKASTLVLKGAKGCIKYSTLYNIIKHTVKAFPQELLSCAP